MIHVFDIVQFFVLLQTSISSLADDGVLKSTSSHNICSRSWELQNRDTLENSTSWDVGTLRPNILCCFCSCFIYVLLVCNTLCSAIVWVLSKYWYRALSIGYCWCLCRPPSWKIILFSPHISYTSLSSSCHSAGPCIVTLIYTIQKDDPMKITCLL